MQSFPPRHVHRGEGAGQLPGKMKNSADLNAITKRVITIVVCRRNCGPHFLIRMQKIDDKFINLELWFNPNETPGKRLFDAARWQRKEGSLFICQLANFLVCRYREHKWELSDPAKDEHHRIVRSKVKGFTDPLIITAATAIGLSAEEVLECIPDNILLFANPGEVFYRAGENAAAVPIWTGDKGVDPDLT
uniref:Anti_prolifrtn domain-containing protein n=1 Tax=Angiostrongylus cantonensis TaxID=6313 RepID=A0A0K0DBI9_ANGCA